MYKAKLIGIMIIKDKFRDWLSLLLNKSSSLALNALLNVGRSTVPNDIVKIPIGICVSLSA